jgi:hypothetical protein
MVSIEQYGRAAFVCVDCGADTSDEYYGVHDAVWLAANMAVDGGMLCIGCLETRIGRNLTAVDFIDAPINEIFPQSARLQQRMQTP